MMINRYIIKFRNYLSLVKFAHSIFALPFALTGFILAAARYPDEVSWRLLLLVILSMIFARNAAMSFNRYIDRDFDSLNPRTSMRELPARILKPSSVLTFCVLNSLLFVLTAYFINKICFYLSPAALLVLLGYSLTKRFTAFSHFFLGLGLALAPTGAYLAVSGSFDTDPVILSLAVLFWVAGFDVIYALQDEHFDREHLLQSIPVKLGTSGALRLSAIVHLVSGALIVAFGFIAGLHVLYWLGTFIFLLLLMYQHTLVKPGDLSKVNLAFFTLNGIASLIYAVFSIADILILGIG